MVKKAFRTINLSRNGMYGQLKFRIRSVLTIQIKSFITICPSLMAISQAIIVTQPNIPLSRLYICISTTYVCLQWSAMSRCPPTINDQCLIRMTSTSSGVWSVPMVTISVDVFPMCCTTLTGHCTGHLRLVCFMGISRIILDHHHFYHCVFSVCQPGFVRITFQILRDKDVGLIVM